MGTELTHQHIAPRKIFIRCLTTSFTPKLGLRWLLGCAGQRLAARSLGCLHTAVWLLLVSCHIGKKRVRSILLTC